METIFKVAFEHEGFGEHSQGMNFITTEKKFIYINPSIFYTDDFDVFIERFIEATMIEYICSKCCIRHYEKPFYPTFEGDVIPTQSLCLSDEFDDFTRFMMVSGLISCPCEIMARKMMRLCEDD